MNPLQPDFFMTRICPQSAVWARFYESLKVYAEAHPCQPPEPPFPLIFGGWFYSNDVTKKERWDGTVDWAQRNGCGHLLNTIPDDQFYEVESPTSYTVGPMGGPMYRMWDCQPRVKPPASQLENCMDTLKRNWSAVAGEELFRVTAPREFTGKRARRLLVAADYTAVPPWGTWTGLAYHETSRRTFTRFRTAVNAAITPHEVDHIDFVPAQPPIAAAPSA
jgi:hypothetical protein